MKTKLILAFLLFEAIIFFYLSKFDSMEIKIRSAKPSDESFLQEMLYQAIFVEDGEQQPLRSILTDPAIARYIEDWGRIGDIGLIAEHDGKPIGAVWVRQFSENTPGFGWIDENTPELSMAVELKHRGRLVGTRLLKAMLESCHRVSLSVSPNNPIIRLYRRYGFIESGKSGTSITMVRTSCEQ